MMCSCAAAPIQKLLNLESFFLGGMQTGLEERCLSGSCESSLLLPKGWTVIGESVSLSYEASRMEFKPGEEARH